MFSKEILAMIMSNDSIEKLAFLLLGWLLGLLAPVIVEKIKLTRENKMGRIAIVSELRDLGCMLSLAAYGVRINQGKIDRKFLEWLKDDLEKYASSEEFQLFIPSLDKQLLSSDKDLKELGILYPREGKGTMLQYYPVPLLDARVSALWSFDTSFQRNLLSIRQSLALLDDLVDRSRKYFDLTFTKLEGDNYRIVSENLKESCFVYAERAQKTVNMIRKLNET